MFAASEVPSASLKVPSAKLRVPSGGVSLPVVTRQPYEIFPIDGIHYA